MPRKNQFGFGMISPLLLIGIGISTVVVIAVVIDKKTKSSPSPIMVPIKAPSATPVYRPSTQVYTPSSTPVYTPSTPVYTPVYASLLSGPVAIPIYENSPPPVTPTPVKPPPVTPPSVTPPPVTPPPVTPPPGPPTSVKLLSNDTTPPILASDIRPGFGCATFIRNSGYGANSITVGSTNDPLNNKDNIAIILIKYNVIKGGVYQVSFALSTKINASTNITKDNTGNVLLYGWDGTFVMDDLKTPATTQEIIIQPNTYTYPVVYNYKWEWSPSANEFRIIFRFINPADRVMIDAIKITKLN
jgi:hypothetical protein